MCLRLYACIRVELRTQVFIVCVLGNDRRNLSYTSFQSTSTYLEKWRYTYNIFTKLYKRQQQQNNNNKNGCHHDVIWDHTNFIFFIIRKPTRHNIKIVKLTYARNTNTCEYYWNLLNVDSCMDGYKNVWSWIYDDIDRHFNKIQTIIFVIWKLHRWVF